jgi:putative Mg2+ transporter-C (MgtC) family protein
MNLQLRALFSLLLSLLLFSETGAWLLRQSVVVTPWLSNRQMINSASSVANSRNNKKILLQRVIPLARQPLSTDSLADSSDSQRRPRRFLWMGLSLLAMILLVPLRATASTIAPPVAMATEAAVIATEVVAAVAPAPIYTISAASPVPAAVENILLLRLVFSAALGAGLGKERSFAKHSAGVRTMALVAMGASAFTVCSCYGFAHIGHYDPSRMAANVASGVGFVGAGVITTSTNSSQNVVHGLTTAATIWLSAAVGVACGVGLFRVATTAAITTIAILRLGRQKPQARPQEPTAIPSSLLEVVDTSEVYVEVDETNGMTPEHEYAEIHDTSVWDEISNEVDSSRPVEPIPHDEVQAIPTKRIDLQMQEVVRSAWINSTSVLVPVETMEQFAPLNRSDLLP